MLYISSRQQVALDGVRAIDIFVSPQGQLQTHAIKILTRQPHRKTTRFLKK